MSRPAKRRTAGRVGNRRGGMTVRPGRVGGARRGGAGVRVGQASEASWRPTAGPRRARPRRSYWLMAGDGRANPDPLVLRLGDGLRVLPVFGFEEEARLFALRTRGDVRRIEPDPLASLLRGPLRGVELVALDPLSDTPADVLDGSASLTRQRFLNSLIGARSAAEGAQGLADGPRETSDRRSP